MLKSKRFFIFTSTAFVICEAVFLVLVQVLSGRANDIASFSAIALACLFALLNFSRSRESILISLALITTLAADWFLVMENPEIRLPAMIFFSVTQLCYFLSIYISEHRARVKLIHLAVRIPVFAFSIVLTFLVLGDGADAVSVISVSYFANLICNVIFAFIDFKRRPIFAVGLLMFLFCDTFVGFSVLGEYLPIAEGSFAYFLAYPGFNAAWLFYVPAQTLISLSYVLSQMKAKKAE